MEVCKMTAIGHDPIVWNCLELDYCLSIEYQTVYWLSEKCNMRLDLVSQEMIEMIIKQTFSSLGKISETLIIGSSNFIASTALMHFVSQFLWLLLSNC